MRLECSIALPRTYAGVWAVLMVAALMSKALLAAYPVDFVQYKVQAWAHYGPSFDYLRTTPIDYWFEEVQASGKENDAGLKNHGIGGIVVDPLNGRLSAYAEANNTSEYDPHSGRWVWRVDGFGAASVYLRDVLSITLPPGTYADTPQMRLDGRVLYNLSATGNYFTFGGFNLGLDGPQNDIYLSQRWPAAGDLRNGQLTGVYPFQLELGLLAPNTTLTNPWTAIVNTTFVLGPDPIRAGLADAMAPGQYSIAQARLDLILDTLYVPTGATLSTASGLFLSNVPVIPEPETSVLLLVGLGLVGWAVRRRG